MSVAAVEQGYPSRQNAPSPHELIEALRAGVARAAFEGKGSVRCGCRDSLAPGRMHSVKAREMLADSAFKLRVRAADTHASEALRDLAERVECAADTGDLGELVPGGRPSMVGRALFAAMAIGYAEAAE